MDESVPMDLLSSKGRSVSSAGGWREAGLARHVNAQDLVSLFVKKLGGFRGLGGFEAFNPMCLSLPWTHARLWRGQ